MEVSSQKTCASCGDVKSVDAFGRSKSRPDGLCSYCKDCRRAREKAAYAANPDRQKAAVRRYYERNKDAIRAAREENVEEYRARARAQQAKRLADADARAEYNAYHRAYRAENRARINEISASYYYRAKETNPEVLERKTANRRRREREAGPQLSTSKKREIWDAHDGLCYVCGRDAEQYDHVQPLAYGGTNDPENIKPVCAGCNARKGDDWPVDFDELRGRVAREYAMLDVALEAEAIEQRTSELQLPFSDAGNPSSEVA